MTNKKILKVLAKLGFVGTDASLKISLNEYGMVYSEKLGWVIFNHNNSTEFRVAYNINRDFINEVYREKAAAISIVVGSTNENSIVSKLESWIACVGQSELNCETLEYTELCAELQKKCIGKTASKSPMRQIVMKPKKATEKNFHQMVYDHVIQNGFELKRDFDMDTYHYLTFNKGNVNVSFELPNKGKKIKSEVCGVYFQLEDAHNKRFSNGHWKFNFHEFSHMDKNQMFEKFINHFDAAMEAA